LVERYGDRQDGHTVSLCVRRATFWDADKVGIYLETIFIISEKEKEKNASLAAL
jgi:hypothetical protein